MRCSNRVPMRETSRVRLLWINRSTTRGIGRIRIRWIDSISLRYVHH